MPCRYPVSPAGLLGFLFLLILVLTLPALAQTNGPPNAPKRQYWVTDQAGILATSLEKRLTDNAKTHEKNTTNQVVVVTVKTLDGWSIERYGRWLGNSWGIGQAGKDNGVLLLVAPNDRRVRIEVGVGLESVLTDSLTKRIIDDEIIPHFKKNQMALGVAEGHKAIIEALGGTYRKKTRWGDLMFFLLLPFFALGRFFGFTGSTSGGFSGGGGSFGGGGASGSW